MTLNLIGTANPSTIAANIALNYKEATPERQSLLIATGLVLFVITFLVNFAARWIAGRSERKLDAMSSRAMQISSPRLPRWAPGLVAVMALAVAGLPAILAGLERRASGCSVAVVVFLVACPLWSRVVEGRRAAVDRLVTSLVWVVVRLRRWCPWSGCCGWCSRTACPRSTRTS